MRPRLDNQIGAAEAVHLLRLGAGLAVLVGLLWGLHTAVLLRSTERSWEEEINRRLVTITRAISADLERNTGDAPPTFSAIQSLARRYGAYRVAVLDRDGKTLADSLNPEGSGQTDLPSGTTAIQIGQVWNGAQLVTGPSFDRWGNRVRSHFIPIRGAGQAATTGVLRLDLNNQPADTGDSADVTALLLKIGGGAALLVLLVYSLRLVYRGTSPNASGGELTFGGTAAVVDTFHGLVRQLKEKEQELDRLRALAEARAAEVEGYNENILQSVTSGVITFNTRHAITTFNHAAERILGLSRNAAVGRTCEQVFGPESNVVHFLVQALTSGRTVSRHELEMNRPEGGGNDSPRIWVGISTSLLRDRQNRVIGTTIVFTDLTEIKTLQEQVELKRRLTVLGEMSAGIAHEFRNYMGSVMGYTKLLSKRLPPSKEGVDSGYAMVSAIMEDLTAMNRLIEQLLSFGRHAEVNLQAVDLKALVRRLIEQTLSAGGASNKITVDAVFPPDLPVVPLDEVLGRQAIGNIIQNAIEAMPEGGTLRVRAAEVEAPASTGSDASSLRREVLLEVRDTGPGIPRERIEKIFLPFFTTKEKGTGMGLALVHKIILSHGGRIEVESPRGGGAVFRIYFPIQEAV